MTRSWWWDLLIGVAGLVLVIVLVIVRPRRGLLREALRLLPDVLRLVRRLAADKALPRGVRIRLWLLMLYLAIPIDVIPDFIPAGDVDPVVAHRVPDRVRFRFLLVHTVDVRGDVMVEGERVPGEPPAR